MTDTTLLAKQFTALGIRLRSRVLAEFYENTFSPKQPQIDYLTKRIGAPPLTLANDGDGLGYTIGAAYAVEDGPGLFSFAEQQDEGAALALVFVARDRIGEPADLIAWWPRTDKVGRLFGRVSLLGEHEVNAPRLRRPHLRIHATIAGWLRAERTGTVLIDDRGAWRLLCGMTVEADSIEHGIKLKAALAAPTVRIVVPETKMRAAA